MNEMMTLRAQGKAELFGAVTAVLGFTPTQSLVLLPFCGERSTGAMRADLPVSAEDAGPMVAQLLEMVCRVPGVTGFVAVVFTDGTARAHEPLAQALRLVAPLFDLAAIEVLYLTPTGWGDFFGAGEAPLDTLPPHPLPERVADGDQHAGASLPVVDEQLRAGIRTACAVVTDTTACNLFEEVLGWDPARLDPVKAAALAAHLAKPLLRDVALIQWASSIEQGRDAMEMQRAGVIDAQVAAIIVGDAARPDPTRLDSAFEACRMVAAHTEGAQRAAALTVCGWLSWALGRSTRAAFFIEQATRTPGAPTFTATLAEIIDRGLVPAWAFAG